MADHLHKDSFRFQKGVCPVTSLPVKTIDEFTNYSFHENYYSTLRKIGDKIIHLELSGNLNYFDNVEYHTHFNQFAELVGLKKPYIQIRDISKATSEIKLKEIAKNNSYNLKHQDDITAIIIIGSSKWLSLILQTGIKLFPQSIKYFRASNYEEAIRLAKKLSDAPPLDRSGSISLTDVVFKPEWEYKSTQTNFSATLGVIPGKILYTKTSGNANNREDIVNYLNYIDKVIGYGNFKGENCFAINDVSELKDNFSYRDKVFFANKLKKINTKYQFSPQFTIITGANFIYKNSFRLVSVFWRQQIVFTDTAENAIQKINTIGKENQEKYSSPEYVSKVTQNDIDEIINFSGSIIWQNQESKNPDYLVSETNPLSQIHDALGIVKKDISELISSYTAILGDISSGIIVTDLITKEILFINNAACSILEIDEKEIAGKKCFQVFPYNDGGICCEDDKCEPFSNKEIVIKTHQGIKKHLSISMSENVFENKPCSIHSFTDISAIKKAQLESEKHLRELTQNRQELIKMVEKQKKSNEKLRISEEKLSTLFSSMTEMVVLHDLVFDQNGEVVNYNITDCNVAFEKIMGISKEKAIGKLATDVYGTKEAPYLKEFSQVAISGVPYEYSTHYEPVDRHFFISVVSPEKNSFATVTTDVTAIKQIQQVITEKNKELENYLYVASHDLRSPLVNIQGFSQRLQKLITKITDQVKSGETHDESSEKIFPILEKDIPKALDFIYTNTSKMDTLISGLLQVSRTGSLPMHITRVHVNQLLDKIVKDYSFQINNLSAEITYPNLDDCYGDTNLLNQLFSNLINNSLKYSDKNRKLSIQINSTKQYNRIVYSISDNGMGISERHIKKIWDVFYRADAIRETPGEGLGLSIVKRIVEKHRGKIWVSSEKGKGSTFYIELQANEFSV